MNPCAATTGKPDLRPRYKIDLIGLQADCDANYLRLLKLASSCVTGSAGISKTLTMEFRGYQTQARVEIKEQTRYTTLLALTVVSPLHRWTALPDITIRMYHDVRMAEVTAVNNHQSLQALYEYPNPSMHQPDEKHQMNRLLAEWLAHCLHTGYSPNTPLTSS